MERILNWNFVSQECMNSFYQLDEKINSVAVKVMHLGGQLEAVNIPRSRAVEAQKLMTYFSEFLNNGNYASKIFSDPNKVALASMRNYSTWIILNVSFGCRCSKRPISSKSCILLLKSYPEAGA